MDARYGIGAVAHGVAKTPELVKFTAVRQHCLESLQIRVDIANDEGSQLATLVTYFAPL